MNKRIQQLKQQATTRKFDGTGTDIGKLVLDEQKFAELIIRECAGWLATTDSDPDIGEEDATALLEHFGLEFTANNNQVG